MFYLSKPTPSRIARFLTTQAKLDVTYSELGATSGEPPSDAYVDHVAAEIGQGERTFVSAQNVLRHWRHFQLGWTELHPVNSLVEVGQTVVVLARLFGIWSMNADRVVDLFDTDDGTMARFGYTIGTLPGHAEEGEERFSVEWNRRDDSVRFETIAFIRPHHLLTQIGWPYLRRVTDRFRREALQIVKQEANAR